VREEKTVTIKMYMCGVDWVHELGGSGDTLLYESLDVLRKTRGCTKTCGIVELDATLKFSRWVDPQDFSDLEKIKELNK